MGGARAAAARGQAPHGRRRVVARPAGAPGRPARSGGCAAVSRTRRKPGRWRGARAVALAALEGVLDRRGWARGLLQRQPGFDALSARDRALALELVHGVLRMLRLLRHLLEQVSGRRIERIDPRARTLALLGIYQLLWLERVPAHAAIHETVALAGGRKRRGFVNAVLRALQRNLAGFAASAPAELPPGRVVPLRPDRFALLRSAWLPDWSQPEAHALGIAFSHPDALVERWLERLGPERTRAVLAADNAPPPVFLRARRGRTDAQALVQELAAEGIAAHRWDELPDAVLLEQRIAPSELAAVREGRASVQDATAQAAALAVHETPLAVPATPPERVADLCAAPGGKACYLAELFGERAEVWAVDRDAARLERLRENVERLGLTDRIRIEVRDARSIGAQTPPFDRVLLDAPCSNTGVLRRRPEARWRFGPGALASLTALQAQLLEAACRLVRPGGILVYSTCSIEHEENAGACERLLERERGWRLVEQRCTLPAIDGPDGGFHAVFERRG
ncbi:MAG: methyltransferase domain-containing protein [Planctomycetota bacterium]|nr:MAG: methyltransferase domain-containing protein [Planctomycetota bacterium]